ncbi:MAG: hypothetical protein KDD59_14280 [Bdellovibrionales bacterium]|nr:hypothetical protein [Bdellovibrionales bacterium]
MSISTSFIKLVAVALGELNQSAVFVGGATVPFYLPEEIKSEARPTEDIDVVLELVPKRRLHDFDDLLRKKGFQNDTSTGAPLCRWILDGMIFSRFDGHRKWTEGWPDLVVSIPNGRMPLSLLDRIIVDTYPKKPNFFTQVESILQTCLNGHQLDIPIISRKYCKKDCECQDLNKLASINLKTKYVTGKWEREFGKVG